MLQPFPVASEQTTLPQETIQKKNLADLKSMLESYVRSAGIACRGMVIGGLDLDQFDHVKAKPYYNQMRKCNVYYVNVVQDLNGIKYQARLLVEEVYGKSLLSTILSKGKKIEITVITLEEGKDTQIMIHAGHIRADGESDYEIANQLIKAQCAKLGYFTRIKRPRPAFFIRIGLITSKAGGVESDIIKILMDSGLQINISEDFKRCSTAEEMTQVFKEMDSSGKYDAICFFRGSSEDPSMAVFRSLNLFETIVNAKTFTACGLCHEQHHPVIEGIVDEACAVPNDFANKVVQHNTDVINSVLSCSKSVDDAYMQVLGKIQEANDGQVKLADSYFSNCINSIRESITDQCAGPFNTIAKSLREQSRYQSQEVSNSYLKIVQFSIGQLKEDTRSCSQSFKDLAKTIFDDIVQTAQKTITVWTEIRGKEDRLKSELQLAEEQKRRIAEQKRSLETDRKNKKMIGALVGALVGIVIALVAQSPYIGAVSGLIVGGLVIWYLLREK